MASDSFSSPGTYTWTVPNEVQEVTLIVKGAEGGEGGDGEDGDPQNYGGSGGGGGTSETIHSVSPGEELTVYVGSGGGYGRDAPGPDTGVDATPGVWGLVDGISDDTQFVQDTARLSIDVVVLAEASEYTDRAAVRSALEGSDL